MSNNADPYVESLRQCATGRPVSEDAWEAGEINRADLQLPIAEAISGLARSTKIGCVGTVLSELLAEAAASGPEGKRYATEVVKALQSAVRCETLVSVY